MSTFNFSLQSNKETQYLSGEEPLCIDAVIANPCAAFGGGIELKR